MSGHGDDDRALNTAELDAWRGFLRTHTVLIHELDADLLAAHDLPLRSYDVLVQLEGAAEHRLRMTELSRSVLLSASGLSRLVDRLESEGLVCRRRCELDGRGYWAELTSKGLAKLREARPTHLAGVRRLFLTRLDENELEALGRLWRQLLSAGDTT
jgi:DNA-binding MarR family transcriptional regulator